MHTFVTSSELEIEPSQWGPHEWLSRPGLTAAEQLLMVRVLMPPGRAHQVHRHPTMQEIIYVISGTAEQWVGQEKRLLGPGDVAHIPQDVVHGTYNAGTDTLVSRASRSPTSFDARRLIRVRLEGWWRAVKPSIVSANAPLA